MTSHEPRERVFTSTASRLIMAVHVLVPVTLLAMGVGVGLATIGVPELGLAAALISIAVCIASCWRIALFATNGGLAVRNLSGTYRIGRSDVVRLSGVEELPWYWPRPLPLTPMVEVRLRDGSVLRLHATALPGRKRRERAAHFIAGTLKVSPHRLRSYVEWRR